MADRRYHEFRDSRSPYRAAPRSRVPRPHTSYPDVWVADKDPHHGHRVDVFKRRRDSIVSRTHSRPGTAVRHDASKPNMRIEKPSFKPGLKSSAVDFLEKDWRKNTPWAKDREMQRNSSLSSSVDTPMSGTFASSAELQEELDRYSLHSEYLLTDNEWVSPPAPRSRARRINPKEFNIEKIKTLKRWNMVQGFMYGMHSSVLRDTDAKQPRESYVPGVIFSAPIHTAVTSDETYVPTDDPNLTATPFGTINSKFRKMVVYQTFGEHVQCLPIYTHNGRGLEGKEFPEEFVSIRDVQDPQPEESEGPYIGIYARRNDQFKGTFIAGKAVVKLTELYTHRYDAPATIEGIIDTKNTSKQRLFALVKYEMNKKK